MYMHVCIGIQFNVKDRVTKVQSMFREFQRLYIYKLMQTLFLPIPDSVKF